MKQKDIVLVVVMVVIGGVLSLVISNIVFSSPKSRQQTAEKVDLIAPDFPAPSEKYFNDRSTNSAQHVTAPTNDQQEQAQP